MVEGAGMRPVTVVLDPETSAILKQRYTAATGLMEEQFSDYRVVDGVQVAFRARLTRNGSPLIERVVERVEFNVPVPSSFFTRPS